MMQPVLRTHLHLQHLVPQVDQLLAPEPSSYKPRLTRSFPHVILVYLWMACYFMQLRCVSSAMKQHHHTKPPRKKDQEKTLLELCTPESPDLPPVRPQEPSPRQSEGPSGDGSGD